MVTDNSAHEKIDALASASGEHIKMLEERIKKLEKRVTEQAVEIHCLKEDVNINRYY